MRRRLGILLTAVTGACLLFVSSASAAPPGIALTAFSAVTTDSAVLEADLNPGGKATPYHFEYGPADCDASPCTSTTAGELSPKAPTTRVKAEVEGLSPGTTYHFRLVAQNGDGSVEGPDHTFKTHVLPQVFDPCPNDAFRKGKPSAHLPDCRAYEQASPVGKNGQDVRGMVPWVKASANGDAVSFLTTTGIPGGVGAQDVPAYLSSRGVGSWSTQGLFPPGAIAEEAFILGWLPDFSETFIAARRFGSLTDFTLLSRSSVDGALTTLVPLGAGLKVASFAGTSADGSVVLFESAGKLTGTNAIEGKANLYAWDKDSGKVSLAGVFNDGSVPPAGAFAGPYAWSGPGGEIVSNVSQGGSASYHYTQDNHAATEDGSVYFTEAGSGQLYLRKNPTESQSALNGEGECTESAKACTVHVSASQGIAPDPLGARPAAFMAATPDGSKVFFTSGEELTDDANTGPEAVPPTIARVDIDGDPESIELDLLPAKATGITLDDDYIYWASPEEGAIGRARLNGSGPLTEVEEDFITGAGIPRYVAVNATHVYWTSAGDELDQEGTIGRATIEGEEVNPSFITGANNPRGIAVNAEHVFWANSGNPTRIGPTVETRTIGRAELDGDEVEQAFIQVDFGHQEIMPQGIALDAAHIYVTVPLAQNNYMSGFLARWDLDGSPASQKSFSDGTHGNKRGVRGIAVDAGHVYWARTDKDTIGRINLNLEEASAERDFIKLAGNPQGVAVDDEHIYWAANQEAPPNPGNDLYRYDEETGDLTDLTPLPGEANGAEVLGVLGASENGLRVYFAANGVLAPGASPGNCQVSVPLGLGIQGSGSCSLYLADDGAIEFIARIDWRDAINWLPHGGAEGGHLEKTARVNPNGGILLFESNRKLTAYDNKGVPALYRYDANQDEIACLSCNPTGAPPAGGDKPVNLPFLLPNGSPASVLSRTLSTDGNRVFFQSLDPLVMGDANGVNANGEADCPGSPNNYFRGPVCQDVYMWEAKGTGSCEQDVQGGGCLYLLSTGKGSSPSFLADASASGDSAFVFTRSQLVGQDADELYDAYDVRVGGGLASQNQLAPLPCEGESACRGQESTPPSSQTPGTSTFSGPGNPKAKKPKPRCPKGKRQVRRRGKVRCLPQRGSKRGTKTTGRKNR